MNSHWTVLLWSAPTVASVSPYVSLLDLSRICFLAYACLLWNIQIKWQYLSWLAIIIYPLLISAWWQKRATTKESRHQFGLWRFLFLFQCWLDSPTRASSDHLQRYDACTLCIQCGPMVSTSADFDFKQVHSYTRLPVVVSLLASTNSVQQRFISLPVQKWISSVPIPLVCSIRGTFKWHSSFHYYCVHSNCINLQFYCRHWNLRYHSSLSRFHSSREIMPSVERQQQKNSFQRY